MFSSAFMDFWNRRTFLSSYDIFQNYNSAGKEKWKEVVVFK
jgi:hypothetical protein